MRITKSIAMKFIRKYNININVLSIETIIHGMKIELEHGKQYGFKTNITNNNLELTFRIALAHLTEYPNYYEYLEKAEDKLKKYWLHKKKPSIYN